MPSNNITPLVSIIIPTFNRLSELLRAIDSVFKQTFQDWEILIVDDGSTDGTMDYFINKNIPKVKYFYKENEGLAGLTRNFAAKKATGKYLAFLDSDDFWYPEKLEKQILVLEKSTKYNFSYTQAVSHENGTEVLVSKKFIKKEGNIYLSLLCRNFIVTSTVVLLRSDFEQLEGFSSDSELTIGEDLQLWLKLASNRRGYYHYEPLAFYDLGGGVSDNLVKKFQCLYLVLCKSLNENRVNFIIRSLVINFYWFRLWLQVRKSREDIERVYQEICLKKGGFFVRSFFRLSINL